MAAEQLTRRQRETLALFGRGSEPLGTSEVATALDLERRTAYARLARLAEDDRLETKKVGGTARVWWRPETTGAGREAGTDDDRTLELYRAVFETVEEGVCVLDDDDRFSTVNDAYLELTGYDRTDLLGAHHSLVTPDGTTAEHRHSPAELVGSGDTVEADLERADGGCLRVECRFTALGSGADDHRAVGVVRDVSERVERTRELRRRVRQQDAVTTLGRRALEARDLDELLAEAAALVAETLDTDYCKILDLDPDAEGLLLRRGVGWADGTVGEATVSATEADSQAAYTLGSWQPVVVSDLDAEPRFDGPDLLRDHDVRSGISTIIGTPDESWGILGTHDTDVRDFSDRDAAFVQSVATVLASAIDRHEYEQKLRDRRERIAALNNLNRVVRGITAGVVEQSTRDEIERSVCERLAETDSYEFAWIGEVESGTWTVRLRTEAGVDGYLDDVTISVDETDERSRGPTGRAFRTGAMQTTRHVGTDSRYGPWRDAADRYGFRSSAAIPIVHETTVYGVLNVYADRPNAFEGDEGEVLAQLGEIVGHAIAVEERKRALLSDEVVELEFRVEDVFGSLGLAVDDTGPIRLDHVVSIDDDYVLFGRTTPDGVETLRRLAESVPSYEEPTVRGDGDERRVELVVSDPPVLSTVASLGGSVEEARIEDGDYHLRVFLSPTVEVRRLVDAVSETFPDATLTKRRQRSRPTDSGRPGDPVLSEALTDRQRAAIESAYHAGFFEWPRAVSGEDVAETLDVTPPTFHQHLRKAEKRILDALLASSVGDTV